MSEWISVNQGLPNIQMEDAFYEPIEYLITDGSIVEIREYLLSSDGVNGANWSAYGEIPRDTITHWMELPEPPK